VPFLPPVRIPSLNPKLGPLRPSLPATPMLIPSWRILELIISPERQMFPRDDNGA
jgi:hypothetical protein